jgi:hypothetical protein
MDHLAWVAARAAQAVSRHLNEAESHASTAAARLRSAALRNVEVATSANHGPMRSEARTETIPSRERTGASSNAA